ncbi:hypothetical protein BDW60DRAFT_183802 [Aspergillus nidulans var. acristatus]
MRIPAVVCFFEPFLLFTSNDSSRPVCFCSEGTVDRLHPVMVHSARLVLARASYLQSDKSARWKPYRHYIKGGTLAGE